MTELWIVRHGETDWNAAGRIQGWTDIPLNPTGLRQARKLAEHLRTTPFHVIISSDLTRARTTAEILAAGRGIPLVLDPLLRERCFGKLEGSRRDPALDARAVTPGPEDGAESEPQVRQRALRFLERAAAAYPCARVLCVSHGGWIRALLRAVGVSHEIALHNTGITRLIHRDGQWHVLEIDDTRHLSDDPAPAVRPTRLAARP
ncbi:histidine phosphatase family protein [Alicyclobacillus sp.]|uniref:histidine phosphatase family protein n=1 Tax=Alicyclobacillus sp. TaxID=61169 RepID=UPI0025BC6523|nr:histidine phosphatase family protein [Alicyclobacillus sp.]MCL6516182.1 histidine phosphatase family protein [Alicyclobacillus sp.]